MKKFFFDKINKIWRNLLSPYDSFFKIDSVGCMIVSNPATDNDADVLKD